MDLSSLNEYLSPFCATCGGVKPGQVIWMVGAYPCQCGLGFGVALPTAVPAIDEQQLRRIFREEIQRALDNLPGSDAERLARDYLEDLGDEAATGDEPGGGA